MASCLACEARLAVGGVEIGETLICDECGAEHEVLGLKPLELILVDDEEEDEVVAHGEDDPGDVEDDDAGEGDDVSACR